MNCENSTQSTQSTPCAAPQNQLMTLEAASALIRSGAALSVAGAESVLRQLPAGEWIGGSIPYLSDAGRGAIVTEGRVFVTNLSDVGQVRIAYYSADTLDRITQDTPDSGFALTIIPAASRAHQHFAHDADSYPEAFSKPIVGWISGVHLSDLGQVTPKVVDGRSGQVHEDGAVVAHVQVPSDKLVTVEIINIFEPDGGDVLRFDEIGFQVGQCQVNGQHTNLAHYLQGRGATDGKLPLVGDYAGARINVSFQSIDPEAGRVSLYAPVFPGVDYRLAQPVSDYAQAFRQRLQDFDATGAVFACNCILNFVFGELQDKAIGGVEGPFTFGEIGYQLLNQTMVVVRLQ